MSEYKETGKIDEIVFNDITSLRVIDSDELFDLLKEVLGFQYKGAFTTDNIFRGERNYGLDIYNDTVYIDYGNRLFIPFENKLTLKNNRCANVLGFIYQGCFISTNVLLSTIERLEDMLKENQINEEENFNKTVNKKFQKIKNKL